MTAPFRAETVGSFLKPQALIDAQNQFKEGKISAQEYNQAVDDAVEELVKHQYSVGLDEATAGGYRRGYWHLDFFWELNGIEKSTLNRPYMFDGTNVHSDSARLCGKLSFNPDHSTFRNFNFLKSVTPVGMTPRQAIPSPVQLYAELTRGDNEHVIRNFYQTDAELFDDIADVYRKTILKLYDLGCRSLMMDDCVWGMFCDHKLMDIVVKRGFDIEDYKERLLKLTIDSVAGMPDDMVIATRIYRGYVHSSWDYEDGYEPIAEKFFGETPFTAFYLRFPLDCPEKFKALRYVPEDKIVVLGLISPRNPKLEDKEVVKAAIMEASKYIPLERLCLSTECGFSSPAEQGQLTEDQQWAKIALVQEIVAEVW